MLVDTFLAEGSSFPDRATLGFHIPSLYSGFNILWNVVPDIPQVGFSKLLHLPVISLYIEVVSHDSTKPQSCPVIV